MQLKTLYETLKTQIDELDARIIIEECTDHQWADIIASPDSAVSEEQNGAIQAILTRRLAGEPLSRILGKRQFWGLDFALSPETLDPRPDTETLVQCALNFIMSSPRLSLRRSSNSGDPEKVSIEDAHILDSRSLSSATQSRGSDGGIRILDMGTGTGCIPIALLHELTNATAIATDIQDGALKTAAQNAKTHGVADRITFRNSNWFDGITEKFDLITSNPPYISPESITNLSLEVQNHDPILALDGGKNGMEPYEIIFSQIKNHLNPGGRAFLEIGYDQCGLIARLAEKTRIRIEAIHPDLAGIPRVVEISCGDK